MVESDSHGSRRNPKQKDVTNPAVSFAAGCVGGVFDVVVHQPFDTVKVRMQSMSLGTAGREAQFRNSFDCFYKTLTREGHRGLYRGMTVVILTHAPVTAIYFCGASLWKRLQGSANVSKSGGILESFWAGCVGGAVTTGIVTPVERVKVLLQVERTRHLGPVHIGKQLWQNGGLRSFYRGNLATLCRDVPSGGVYLATYEWVKQYLCSLLYSNQTSFTVLPTVLAGGAAGLTCCIVGIPPDVLKSRLQTAPDDKYPNGMRSVCKELIRKEGLLSFYRGFTPVALYALPGSAACMLGYELTLEIWRKLGAE